MGHQQFVELFDEYLEAVYPPAGGHRQDTGRKKLAAAVIELLRDGQAERVLDCSAGTGFPSLDIHEQAPDEFVVHCCDGDPTMVAMLARRAGERGIAVRPLLPSRLDSEDGAAPTIDRMVLNWAELDLLGAESYDYVLCRGNSLVYADTWSGGRRVASSNTIETYLTHITRQVRRGGFLHVDAPLSLELKPTRRRVLGTVSTTTPRSISEDVKVDLEAGRRGWTLRFEEHDKRPISFTRYSSLLTIDDIGAILRRLGYEETAHRELPDERSNFGVIVARKPA